MNKQPTHQPIHAVASVAEPAAAAPRNPFRAPWVLFWVGLGLRLFFLTIGKLYVKSPMLDYTKFGSEAGHIARAILQGRGYADPFDWIHTGPTAWLAPGYPLLMTAVFKAFGIYTLRSAWVVVAIQCVLNAAMARWVWEIGTRCFGRRVGNITGWIFALSPWAMLYALMLIWETSISTALFMWAFAITLRLRGIGEPTDGATSGFTWARWIEWGFAWGMVALFNPSILIFLPCAGFWLLAGRQSAAWPLRRRIAGATAAGLVFVTMMMPWWVRNERVFHKFLPTRGNLGVEFCYGNCHGIGGVLGQWDDLPWGVEEYARMGEVAYNAARMHDFEQVVLKQPKLFVGMSLLRFDFYWFGVTGTMESGFGSELSHAIYAVFGFTGLLGAWLAWRRKLPAAGLFLMAVLTMPTLYYLVEVQERYRQPLEPLLYVLGVFTFCAAQKSWRVGWFRRECGETDLTEPWATASPALGKTTSKAA